MLCTHCRSLAPALRRLPGGPLAPLAAPEGLWYLLCARCGAAASVPRPSTFPETLLRLERAGLGIAGPLLRRAAAST